MPNPLHLAQLSELEQAKLAALAEFAAGAGHEINNPLAAILGRSQLLLRGETDPERRRALAAIGGQAIRIKEMIGDLMLFARPPQPKLELLDLANIVTSTVSKFADQIREQGITCSIQVNLPHDLRINADGTQTAIVVSELLRNAIHAASPNGWIDLLVEKISGSESPAENLGHDQSFIALTMDNSGPPLSETARAHLFDPFFSGRDAGRGLGFGLCKVWRILQQHGGWVAVDSNATLTSFTVAWPINTSD